VTAHLTGCDQENWVLYGLLLSSMVLEADAPAHAVMGLESVLVLGLEDEQTSNVSQWSQ